MKELLNVDGEKAIDQTIERKTMIEVDMIEVLVHCAEMIVIESVTIEMEA